MNEPRPQKALGLEHAFAHQPAQETGHHDGREDRQGHTARVMCQPEKDCRQRHGVALAYNFVQRRQQRRAVADFLTEGIRRREKQGRRQQRQGPGQG